MGRKKNRRILAVLCVFALVGGQVNVAGAQTASQNSSDSSISTDVEVTTEQENEQETETIVEAEEIFVDTEALEELPDNDELFAGYVEKTLYGTGKQARKKARSSTNAGSYLTGVNKEVYDSLKEQIEKVASGDVTSTEFTVTRPTSIKTTEWTAEELEVNAIKQNGSLTDAARKAVYQNISFDFSLVTDATSGRLPL